jgi:hypothetical protein
MGSEFIEIMDVKNEFLQNVGPEYARAYPPQQLDLALYLLNDFCNNLVNNGLVLFRQVEAPQPVYEQPYPQPSYQQPAYQVPPYQTPYQQPYQPPQQQVYGNPFEEDLKFRQQQEYENRLRAEQGEVQRNISEMNAQLQQQQFRPVNSVRPQPIPRQEYVPPRQEPRQEYIPPQPQPQQPSRASPFPQPTQQPVQDINLANEKPKTFVDKIKEMRTPKKGDKINPEE